jgi:hypothetical protein
MQHNQRSDIFLKGKVDAVSPPLLPPPPPVTPRAEQLQPDCATTEAIICARAADAALEAMEEAQKHNRAWRAMSVCAMAIAIAGDDVLAKSALAAYMAAAIIDADGAAAFETKFLH